MRRSRAQKSADTSNHRVKYNEGLQHDSPRSSIHALHTSTDLVEGVLNNDTPESVSVATVSFGEKQLSM